MLDFNKADQQTYDLIPANTICPLIMNLQPGGVGQGGYLTQSQNSDAQYLKIEFTVTAGPFARRKFWANMVLSGGKLDEAGNSIAGKISASTLRAIVESARGINPLDESEAACKARMLANDYADFEGMEFLGKVGVEKGKDGYDDKNKLTCPITPDKKEYSQFQAGQFSPTPVAAAQAPTWGNSGQPAAQAPANAGTPAWTSPQPQPPAPAQPAPTQTAPAQAPAAAVQPVPPQPAPTNSPVPAWAQ